MYNMFNTNSILISFIILISCIYILLIAGVYPYLERKKLATIQRRVGPKVVGLNGRLQFLVDAVKILFKQYIHVFFIKKNFFFLLPVIFLLVNFFFLLNFITYNNFYMYDIEYNMLFFLINSSISSILVFLTGIFCKNKYTIIASSRSIVVFFINELILSVILAQFVLLAGSFSFSDYILQNSNDFGFFIWLFLIPSLFLVTLVEINKSPFDFLEAESELVMGISTEYTGFLFGIYVLIEYIHIFIFSIFLSIILI